MSKTIFVNNKAKIFSLGIKAPNYVIKGDKVAVESYLTRGDNILNAIYTTNNNVVKDGLNINKSNKPSGVTMIIEANNKKYTSKSSSTGVAEIKIPTLSSATSPSLKITVLYDKKGEPKKKATVKVSYKSLKKSYLTNIKSNLKKLKVSDYKGYSKVLNYEKQIKQYLKDVKKSKLSKTNKNNFNKLANKVLSSINTKKINSLTALTKTINNKRTFASSSEKKSYSSQLKDLKKTISNSKDLTKKSKKNKITEINKLINKVNKLQIQSRTPFSTTTYEGSTKVVTKWSDLIKAKNDYTEITAKVVTKKKINVTAITQYFVIVDNNISTENESSDYSHNSISTKEILVDDKVTWILLTNDQLKNKYKWYYQNGTISKYYKGTKQVLKYDKSGKLISNKTYYNQQCTEKSSKIFQSDYSSYVNPSEFCEADNPEIINLANNIKKNSSDKSDIGVANAILKWVQLNIQYELYGDTLYGALGTLHAKKGNCADQAHLTVALMRAINLPARYVAKNAIFDNERKGHGWANFYSNSTISDIFMWHDLDDWLCGDPVNNRTTLTWNINFGSGLTATYVGNKKLGYHFNEYEWCTVTPYNNSGITYYFTGYSLPSSKLENIGGQWYRLYQWVEINNESVPYWGNYW
ncbi:transglutaminase-like superfamily protein [Methanobrevibacter curvatus]|uniref:Transglutaminase-like superfamily protein n=1 Tax=Methanobrevibacter curvatus TaxID=49547 RepID=A0A165ZG17_9EURY|nr:transglutaminase-like superfamily protein [Methanobrevibacter curvatus]